MVTYLLSKGVNADLKDKHGYTALDEARSLNFTEIVTLLENYVAQNGER